MVTSAPRLEVPETSSDVVLEIAASRFRLPVILIAFKLLFAPTVFTN